MKLGGCLQQQDRDAERAVLGGVMMYPRIVDDLPIVPEDFWDVRHEELYRLIVEQARRGEPVDPVALSSRVDSIRGASAAWLHELYSEAPSSDVQVEFHAKTLADVSVGRAVRASAARLAQGVDDSSPEDLQALIEAHRAEVDGVANRTAGVQVRSFSDVLSDAVRQWSSPQDRRVWPTGWAELDDVLNGGWKPGQLTILGARPAVGKSAVASCATVAAHDYGAGFFSLEMSELELAGRMVAIERGIDLDRIEKARFTNQDWEKINTLMREAPNWRVWLEAKPRRSIAQVRATVRSWSRKGHVPLIVVDYLQLLAPADTRETRERQVSRLAEDCKALAKDFDCHVLALAQVNRGSTMRDDKRPTMSDLRESGGIEANADNVILLHREDSGGPDATSEIEFNVVKNRHGRTDRLSLAWRPNFSSVNQMGPSDRSYPFGLSRS